MVQLTDDAEATGEALAAAAAEVDIVIDYLWGKPAQQAIMALLTARADRSRALDWIQIGAVAGPTIELPSVALRSANFRLQGSGQGSVSPRGYLAELPSLIDEISAGTIGVQARTCRWPTWSGPGPARRPPASAPSSCPSAVAHRNPRGLPARPAARRVPPRAPGQCRAAGPRWRPGPRPPRRR